MESAVRVENVWSAQYELSSFVAAQRGNHFYTLILLLIWCVEISALPLSVVFSS